MTEIRSYRTVFHLERRIYRVDRLRLNPTGVPLRGIVYFLAILTTSVVLAQLPLVGVAARLVPWYLREVVLPGAIAALLTQVKIEGRPSHIAALSLLRFACGSRELANLRPRVTADRCFCPNELIVLADGSDAWLRRLRFIGPGVMRVSVAHSRTTRRLGPLSWWAHRPSIALAALPEKRPPAHSHPIALPTGACLEVRP